MSNAAGRLYIVATPIGNLDDITLRAIEVLRTVDCIAAEDTRGSRRLLTHLGISRPLVSLHAHNEDASGARLLERLRRGEQVALVSDAGTPLISDPGYPLVLASREAGIEVCAVPGPSALTAALSGAGLPTDRFRFEGFPPRRAAARRAAFERLSGEPVTLVFYEASHRIVESVADMAAVFGGERRAVIARELTMRFETVLPDTLAGLSARLEADEDQRRGEFVVLVAGVDDDKSLPAVDPDRVLDILLAALPVRQAAGLAAEICNGSRNELYRRALARERR